MDEVEEVVPPSSEPAPAEAPSEEPTEPVEPAEPVEENKEVIEPVEPTEPVAPSEPSLYELPDGRKVTGDVLTKEWKENFLPDYTQKSQKLAAIEKPNQPSEQEPAWKNPEWVPQSGAELLNAAEEKIRESLDSDAQKKVALQEQVGTYVESQIEEIKKIDPKVDQNLIFQEANKIKTNDLMAAYKNIKSRESLVKTTEERVLKDAKLRGDDPITVNKDNSNNSGEIEYNPNESAQEYLARIKQ